MHNLTEDDIETKEDREKIEWNDYSNAYCRVVVMSIANLFFCKYYYKTRIATIHNIVGKTSNVVTAQLLAQYVMKSIEKEGAALLKSDKSSGYVNSFKKGVANTIAIRCRDMIKVQETDVFTKTNGTSVVLKSIYDSEKSENDAFVASLGHRLSVGPQRRASVYTNAYEHGGMFGKGISLNASIGSQNVVRISS